MPNARRSVGGRMSLNAWPLIAANVLTASILVLSGMAKLASPQALTTAFGALTGNRIALSANGVRVFAAAEAACAAVLLIPQTREFGAIAVATLGLLFSTSGIMGRFNKVRSACGCLGNYSTRPLGSRQILAGL